MELRSSSIEPHIETIPSHKAQTLVVFSCRAPPLERDRACGLADVYMNACCRSLVLSSSSCSLSPYFRIVLEHDGLPTQRIAPHDNAV